MCTPPLWPKRICPMSRPRPSRAMRSRICRSIPNACRRNISTTRPARSCSKRSRGCRNITRPAPSSRSCAIAPARSRRSCPKGAALVEFGAGATTKVRLLLENCAFSAYVPVDISGDFLNAQADALAQGFPFARGLSGGGRFHRAVRAAGCGRNHAEGRASSRARPSAISSRMRPAASCALPARFWARAR